MDWREADERWRCAAGEDFGDCDAAKALERVRKGADGGAEMAGQWRHFGGYLDLNKEPILFFKKINFNQFLASASIAIG